jgi:4-amino-4-deoxy-L-arabinose transferase-like glycosyltransferase
MRGLRILEWLLLLLGVALRLALPSTFEMVSGFDYRAHRQYIDWLAQHGSLPPADLSYVVFHPPLYYFVTGWAERHGLVELGWVNALSGCLRLAVIVFGLRRLFPERPLARVVAIGCAALLPTSLHADAVLGPESLHATFATLSILCLVLGLRERAWRFAPLAGLWLGLALLTKISSLLLVVPLALAALTQLVERRRWRAALPWLSAGVIALAISGWWFQRNLEVWHTPFPTSFDSTQKSLVKRLTPSRRPATFYWKWQPDYYDHPCAYSQGGPEVRFWPTLIVTSFVDFYNYGFGYRPTGGAPSLECNTRPLRRSIFDSARVCLAGATVLALTVLLAWLASLRTRDPAFQVALVVPAFAVLAQLHFAVAFPFDELGVIKGQYLLFAATPLYVLTGVALEWCWRRQRWLAAVLLAALAAVAQYTLLARGLALLG